MFQKIIILLWIYGSVGQSRSETLHNTKVLSIGFLFEQQQKNIPNEVSTALKELETSTGQKIVAHFTTIYRKNLNETMNMFCSSLYKGISVILDLSYSPWDDGLDLITSIEIPYIKVDVSIGPLLRVMESYLEARGNAFDAVLIFQNERDVDEALYYIVRGSNLRVILIDAMMGDFAEKINRLRPTPSYYVIFATTRNMDTIFGKILDAKIFTRPDKWHLFYLDFNAEDFKYKQSAVNATKITPDTKICRLHDIECEMSFSKLVLKEVISRLMKTTSMSPSRRTWNCENILNITSNDAIDHTWDISPLFNDSIMLRTSGNEVSIHLDMSMQIYTSDPPYYNDTATWMQGELKLFHEYIKPARRFFRIGTAESIPWSYIRRDPATGETILDEDGNPIWDGYCIDLIAKLAERMNFDYELVIPKKGTFGKRLQDGKWDGLIGDLVSGETDIAVAALKMTSDKEEVIDFIAPYFEQTGISIVIRKAVRQTSLFKFMTVLRLEVWLSIVASLVATAIMIWLLDKYSPYSARNNKKAYPYPCREFTLKESFWFALTSFTPQGGGEAPKAISGRTLVAAYWLFVVLMLATFTANLAAFLTVERMQTPVQSLEQLARQSRINYTVVEGSDTHQYFINMKYAEDTLYRMWKELTLNATSDETKYRIWDYPIKEQYGHILLAINSSIPVKDAAEGFRKVNEHENADFAFIHDSAEIKYEITKNCNLTEVGEIFAEQPYAIAVQQGSNLQDELSYAVLEFQKDRFFERLTEKFWNNSISKECSGSEDNEGITLESLGGVFIATLFGLALAMVTLVGEIIYYRRKDLKTKGNQVSDVKLLQFSKELPVRSITKPPSFEEKFKGKRIPTQITFGDEFIPSKQARMRVSYIPVQPRNSIHNQIPYYE